MEIHNHRERDTCTACAAPARRLEAATLPESLRGDGPCDDCGTLNNPLWFTLNTLWNEVRGGQEKFGGETYSIVCPQCFIRRAAEAGIQGAWLLIPGWPLATEATR